MNYVQPIRSKEKIEEMKEELKKNGTRDYMLFTFGINIGLRISDIIKLKVRDICNDDGNIKKHIEIMENKTRKIKRFKINPLLSEDLSAYVRGKDLDEYLFKSRNGTNEHITRNRAYTILNNAAKKCGLDNIGTHTLKKTFGYWLYKQTHDIALLQQLYNHSSPSITLRYIGINQDVLDNAYDNFIL